MSDEKKIVEEIQADSPQEKDPLDYQTLPEWTKGMPEFRKLLQGMAFTFGACIHVKGESIEKNSPVKNEKEGIDGIAMLKSLPPEKMVLEMMSGILLQWLSHQTTTMPSPVFNHIVGPLPETIAGALHQMEVIPLVKKEKIEEIHQHLSDKFKEQHGMTIEQMVGKQLNQQTKDLDQSALESAVEKLKRVGKGLLH